MRRSNLYLVVVLAMLYALLGKAGLLLAIPPGYASPIFPAAGLAMAATLKFGKWSLPGIWIGSFILNASQSTLSGGLNFDVSLLAVAIAFGSTTQAWLGSSLIQKLQRPDWQSLESERDILILVAGAIAACTIAASVGTVALLITGQIGTEIMRFTWWSWYVGDLMGVLTLTPLIWSWLNKETTSWTSRKNLVLYPVLLSLSLATVVFYTANRWENEELLRNIQADGETVGKLIENRLIAHQEVLLSLRHFIEATPNFSFDQFETFTRITLKDNPDIFAMSFNDEVQAADRAAYEHRIQSQSPITGFQITERNPEGQLCRAGDRPRYVVVRHIVPMNGNKPAIGFDIYSEPMRRDTVERATASGAVAVTGPIHLVQEKKQRVGLLALLSVYRSENAAEHNAESLRGFAVEVLKVDELIEIATRNKLPAGLAFVLTDVEAPSESGLLARFGDQSEADADLRWTKTLRLGGRNWELAGAPTSAYLNAHRPFFAWITGVIGLIFSAVLQILFLGATGRTTLIRRQRDELAEQQQRIEHIAFHDALTGLPNRVLGKDHADQAIQLAARTGNKVAVLFLDLDKFKLVNDTYGHVLGDLLLKAVAERLHECLRASDSLCRLSGDEFMAVLSQVDNQQAISTVSEKILESLSHPFTLDGHLINTSFSIGIAVFPNDGENTETLLQHADTALFEAKRGGRNVYQFYNPRMSEEVHRHVRVRDELKLALERHELEVYYQPQVRINSRSLVGVEALVRWNHPAHGLTLPGDFISIAEESGLIEPIGELVLRESCLQAARWHHQGIPFGTVAVNLSSIQFNTGHLRQLLPIILDETGLPPDRLELELTESILMKDTEETRICLEFFESYGIKVVIDDFGTGYSSLAYLRRFKVHKLKIDQSFVQHLLDDQESEILVRAIIQMAKSLNLETLAEGIESEVIAAKLADMGCDSAQGRFYGSAMTAEALEKTWKARPY